jgi:hypothetical protein
LKRYFNFLEQSGKGSENSEKLKFPFFRNFSINLLRISKIKVFGVFRAPDFPEFLAVLGSFFDFGRRPLFGMFSSGLVRSVNNPSVWMVRNDDRENKRFGSELLKKRKTKKKSKK